MSRRNALRHGLTAETVIDGLEDSEDYRAFEAAITSDYMPRRRSHGNSCCGSRHCCGACVGSSQSRPICFRSRLKSCVSAGMSWRPEHVGLSDQMPDRLTRGETEPLSFSGDSSLSARELTCCFLRLGNLAQATPSGPGPDETAAGHLQSVARVEFTFVRRRSLAAFVGRTNPIELRQWSSKTGVSRAVGKTRPGTKGRMQFSVILFHENWVRSAKCTRQGFIVFA